MSHARAIHLFPDTSGQPALEAFRSRFDRLHKFIPAHLSLVFPFRSSIGDAELVEHVRGVAKSFGPFSLHITQTLVSEDQHLWLSVTCTETLQALYTALNVGPWSEANPQTHPFRPHITVARPPLPASLEQELQGLTALCPLTLNADQLVIERILEDESSEIIARIGLG